jgi:transposase
MTPELDQSLAHAIREHVLRVLHDSRGPQEASRRLRIGRSTLYRWLKQWKAEDARLRREKRNERIAEKENTHNDHHRDGIKQ